MLHAIENAVIGAGVIGLAVARALALDGREVVVLEAAEAIGTGVSSRNSEVIHAGIYFAPDCLKTRLCVAGRTMLYGYCAEHGVAHRRCGKLIVANGSEETGRLRDLFRRGAENGVDDLEWLDGAAARRLEPALQASAAILSPSSGVIDSHAFMLALRGDAEAGGAAVALLSPVTGGSVEDGGIVLDVGGAEPTRLGCARVFNCAGLGAQRIAHNLAGLGRETIPRRYMAKGTYFTLRGKSPFQRLIYPMPLAGGLGVHLTVDLAGRTRFGPDVEWVEDEEYSVDPDRAKVCYDAVRSYWPELADDALQPDYAGIRPKVQAPGEATADFVIQGPEDHGVKGLVNLYGIESPGLTAALAIAGRMVELVK
ncbi:MAG: NAD(P)/FAD-dependent oxidoreductase [Rhodospirillales bacterium]|jgi:L-2-hydroxyglutarate oxidase LhgO|nr:NAD(P)/FAD-dependent oxidoreductase [Rhodospirillales bacterium]MDP6882702.1 NAD(P)/FAD-dependent oxidoreductase [Rhodospirillales bacterium]